MLKAWTRLGGGKDKLERSLSMMSDEGERQEEESWASSSCGSSAFSWGRGRMRGRILAWHRGTGRLSKEAVKSSPSRAGPCL